MFERCSIETCKSSSRTQCHCCKKNFCRNHFIEHDNLPNLQLNSLVDEINSLNDRITTLNVTQLNVDSVEILERWRVYCFKLIDDIFKKKCQEIDQQRNELVKIRSTIVELIRKQETNMNDIDLLKANIHTVEEEINNIEQTNIEVVIYPLKIDNNLIRVGELFIPYLDLSLLQPWCKKINNIRCNLPVIADNDRFFLVYQPPNLCLMNEELSVIKRTQWNHDAIRDMCWSSEIARFFIITENDVYIVNYNRMSIKPLPIDQDQDWWSCTCSDTSLYLSTGERGSSIFKFSFPPSIKLEKQWVSPETCTQYQRIINMVYKNETLAMTILDLYMKKKMLELRSSTTLQLLWSFKLNTKYSCGIFGCCSLNRNDFLVWDYDTSLLLHICKEGKAHVANKYKEGNPIFVLSHGNELVISTNDSINFHQIKSLTGT